MKKITKKEKKIKKGKKTRLLNIKIYKLKNIPNLKKKYNIKEKEYDQMTTFAGVLSINPDKKLNSFIFISNHGGTNKMIVFSRGFLYKILKDYKTK